MFFLILLRQLCGFSPLQLPFLLSLSATDLRLAFICSFNTWELETTLSFQSDARETHVIYYVVTPEAQNACSCLLARGLWMRVQYIICVWMMYLPVGRGEFSSVESDGWAEIARAPERSPCTVFSLLRCPRRFQVSVDTSENLSKGRFLVLGSPGILPLYLAWSQPWRKGSKHSQKLSVLESQLWDSTFRVFRYI